MKYTNLIQICDHLQIHKNLDFIKRVGDTLFLLSFCGEKLFFDMNKTNSNIHKNRSFVQGKIYKAPFDMLLLKRFTKSEILLMKVLKNNRILHIKTSQMASYKSLVTNIYFEFTGRFTNVIITDENGIILEALRHFDSPQRSIKVGNPLVMLGEFNIKEKECDDITDFDLYFKTQFDTLYNYQISTLKANKILAIDKKLIALQDNLSLLQSEDELMKSSQNALSKAKLITANLYQLKEFMREFELVNFDGNLVQIHIKIPPKLAAKKLFEEAKKIKQKALNIHIECENLKEKFQFFSNLKSMILSSNSIDEIQILMPKNSQKQRLSSKKDSNTQDFYIREFKISVGKNEKGNIEILKNSTKNDVWFHLKDIPSAHVCVKTNKQNLDDEIINFAAKICVNFSVKNGGNYLVDYTKRSNIKVTEGALVHYTNYKTIAILKA